MIEDNNNDILTGCMGEDTTPMSSRWKEDSVRHVIMFCDTARQNSMNCVPLHCDQSFPVEGSKTHPLLNTAPLFTLACLKRIWATFKRQSVCGGSCVILYP
jgi:hypothetical protein